VVAPVRVASLRLPVALVLLAACSAGGDVPYGSDAQAPLADGAAPSDGNAPDASAPDGASPDPCAPIANVSYALTPVTPKTKDAATHGDVNLLLRSRRVAAGQAASLVDIAGPTDGKAPKLQTLFEDARSPTFRGVYQLAGWDWGKNAPSDFMIDPPVTMAGFAMGPAETVRLPQSGYDLGGGFQALVLYATTDTITLKYTRDDDVVSGYTIHLANVCVEPRLRALYEQANAAGRTRLPGLAAKQPLGRARGGELLVTIRDTGAWMDPRSRKDWYQP
jgi:hypothetical protein